MILDDHTMSIASRLTLSVLLSIRGLHDSPDNSRACKKEASGLETALIRCKDASPNKVHQESGVDKSLNDNIQVMASRRRSRAIVGLTAVGITCRG